MFLITNLCSLLLLLFISGTLTCHDTETGAFLFDSSQPITTMNVHNINDILITLLIILFYFISLLINQINAHYLCNFLFRRYCNK